MALDTDPTHPSLLGLQPLLPQGKRPSRETPSSTLAALRPLPP